ncbi:hypothetical protein NLI96_g10526 [Meripilus lineatus]|uniref:Uncharacterized protein n=1 Tax=Meripilus lineatus TaxID=2056292 RepID=A0AAD5UTL2_9APHY|nr:hypothetical protein NLI96_g10526 [Physisporinus lineatus]
MATPVVKPTIAITAMSTPSGSEGLVTPPTTPPNVGRSRSSSLPTEFDYKPVEETSVPQERPHEFEDVASAPRITLIGGMPATTVEPVVPESEVPFSPTSPSRNPVHFMSFEGLGLSGISGAARDVRGLVSPPRSRDASEDGGSGEGGRSSPTLPILDLKIPGALGPIKLRSTSPTSTPPNERSKDQAGSPAASSPSSASSSSSSVSSMFRSLESPLSPVGNNAGRVDTTDSSYAAFVRQWCFAQSTPPTPGVQHSPDTNEGSAHKASSSGGHPASSGSASVGKKWTTTGYGFPGFNFGVGVTPDAGMVGGESRP